jgi:predicted ArsR family transcriptional regulator
LTRDPIDEVLSSRVRLRIAAAVSVRPRTLAELASLTGISVQGVLRHLKRLVELGIVEERKLVPRTPKARRVYSAKGSTVGDYSSGGLTIVRSTERVSRGSSAGRQVQDLEGLAGEVLIHRRRIAEQAKKLARLIDALVEQQEALSRAMEQAKFTPEEGLLLGVLLTEETIEEGARVLSTYYGLDDRRSIDKALAKARRIGFK